LMSLTTSSVRQALECSTAAAELAAVKEEAPDVANRRAKMRGGQSARLVPAQSSLSSPSAAAAAVGASAWPTDRFHWLRQEELRVSGVPG
jgi:hypothetical protein